MFLLKKKKNIKATLNEMDESKKTVAALKSEIKQRKEKALTIAKDLSNALDQNKQLHAKVNILY